MHPLASLLLFTIPLLVPSTSAANLPIRLISHNIRYAADGKGAEKDWSDRRPLVVDQLRSSAQNVSETFLCLQEALHDQVTNIKDDLNGNAQEWDFIGVGRDDGKKDGEYSPIFYRTAVWTMEEFKTVWLSPTPEKPSKGWGAGSIRIVTIGVFKHNASQRRIVGTCTHLDNVSSEARSNGAKIIIDQINNYTGVATGAATPLPVFLGGDFNSVPTQEAYVEMSSKDSPVEDVRTKLSPVDNTITFTGFNDDAADDVLLDFLWLGPKTQSFWEVKAYEVLPNKIGGVFNSDHRAVMGDVVLL